MNRPVIEIRDLDYRYPDGTAALAGITLDIHAGESVGIIGANGAGKTTLLLHLNGIIALSDRVKVLGEPVNKDTVRTIRSKVGLVFQDPDDQLFSPTVFDDVSFGPVNLGLPAEEVRERVRSALGRVGMDGYEARTPHHMSTGEKKKIAIATVLSLPCEILVLDEPTSNLDPRSRRGLLALLKGLPQTKIIAGHDQEAMREICTRCIVMDRGRIVADGKPGEVAVGE